MLIEEWNQVIRVLKLSLYEFMHESHHHGSGLWPDHFFLTISFRVV
jgi:hypothetical protein